tara:strand:- start:391 stop:651 length:261 start_codon:yes stop_codon:yes gene_type:complete
MSNITEGTSKDWEDFWHSPEKSGSWGQKEITLEQYQAAQLLIKEYERQCNLKEQAYYDARARLDAKHQKEIKIIREQGGFEWTPGN